MIHTALKRIRNDEFDKIVLARRVELEMLSYPNPFSIISELRKTNHHTVSFCFQPREDMTFIGVTPEILYRRKNREILSEAVAGTRLRGRNNAENESLAKELLTNEKELREHGFVTKSLKRNLSRLCADLTSGDKITVLKLSQLQHLYVPFKGTLEKEVTDGEILEALHPTPAVGGFPEKSILPILKQSEPFNRGWYAAPVGWTGADSATFAVAIRSALILKNKIYLYSGAGIVDGSSPEKEWEELDNKIAHYKKLLGVDGKQTKKHQQLLGLSAG
jgi:menaquinone-specific isochorismate synthase